MNKFLVLFLSLVVLLLGVILWQQERELERLRESAEAKSKHEAAAAERSLAGADEVDDVRQALPESEEATPITLDNPEPATIQDAATSTPPAEHMVMTPSGLAPAPRDSGLVLKGSRAVSVDSGGLGAQLDFDHAVDEPVGIVALEVRLPNGSDSRIVRCEVVSDAPLANVMTRISDDGKFAVYHGTAMQAGPFSLNVEVTAPVVADVRGTAGIGPYDLQFTTGGLEVLSK